jgi:hypothetical protein
MIGIGGKNVNEVSSVLKSHFFQVERHLRSTFLKDQVKVKLGPIRVKNSKLWQNLLHRI